MEGEHLMINSLNAIDVVRMLVVDHHPLVRKGIIDIISTDNNYEISEAHSMAETINILKQQHIDILVVDLHIGNDNGFKLIEKVRNIYPEIKYVILTSSINICDYKKAMEIDVDGYIIKDDSIEDIILAFQTVSRGEKYFSPHIFEKLHK